MYQKTNKNISFKEFSRLALNVEHFTSIKGRPYQVLIINNGVITFRRESTGKVWKMDLEGVFKA